MSAEGWAPGFAVDRAGSGLHMDGTVPQTFRHHGAMDEFNRGDPVVIIALPDEIEFDDLAASVAAFIDSVWAGVGTPDDHEIENQDGS